jgi:hypothetical protein
MNKLLSLGAAAIACAAVFGTATPATAKDYEYCRRDSSYIGKLDGSGLRRSCRSVSEARISAAICGLAAPAAPKSGNDRRADIAAPFPNMNMSS